MPGITWRESAKADLIAQWVWYAENASLEIADRFLAAAESTVAMLAHQPESGSHVPVTHRDLQRMRRFPVTDGFHAIWLFYLPLKDGIDLVRVLHGSRDLQDLFADE